MEYKSSVFIGRFQPFHNAHLEVVKYGLSISDKVIIIIGSRNAAPNIKNPWTFEQRREMIRSCFSKEELDRINFIGVRDYYYNDNHWIADIQSQTSQFIQDGDSVALLGNYKDSSSYYLKYFPQWELTPVKTTLNLNSTDIRNILFKRLLIPTKALPKIVYNWIYTNYYESEEWNPDPETGYKDRVEEFKFLKDYKKSWEKSPFPPTFVTVDSIVVSSGHVLVIKRGLNPGKGLYALPGGFIKQNERIESAALRELKEETGIKVDKIILESAIIDSKVFDHPDRSLRGRTISHGFYIKLKDGVLPEVRGNDDAASAKWMPLISVTANESKFFEDHMHIINYFVSRG